MKSAETNFTVGVSCLASSPAGDDLVTHPSSSPDSSCVTVSAPPPAIQYCSVLTLPQAGQVKAVPALAKLEDESATTYLRVENAESGTEEESHLLGIGEALRFCFLLTSLEGGSAKIAGSKKSRPRHRTSGSQVSILALITIKPSCLNLTPLVICR